MAKTKQVAAAKTVTTASKATKTSKVKQAKEIEIDSSALLVPLSIVIAAVIIAVPTSLSIYFGLSNAGLGVGGNTVQAAECDDSEPLSEDCLIEKAGSIGLDTNQFQQCLVNKKYDSVVDTELAAGEDYGVSGTPSVFLGENKGDKMEGFQAGAGVTIDEMKELAKSITDNGIQKAVEDWKNSHLDELDSYEQQVEDFYSQQGQSGDTLKASVNAAVSSRKTEIETSAKVETYEYGDGMLRGNQDAKAVVMEFSDYECPYCIQFAQGVGGQLKTELVDTGEVLFVYREFPLESIHPNARRGALAARCAGEQNKYFEMHDVIFGAE